MNRDDEMREVEANTTPGYDPRVEEMARERQSEQPIESPGMDRGGDREMERREMEPERESDRQPMERRPVGAQTQMPYDRGAGSEGAMLEGYRSRFTQAQARFIDDPKAAVVEARSVLEEAVDRFMQSLGRETGDGSDTERMRLAMQRYRDIFERLAESGSSERLTENGQPERVAETRR